MNQQQGNVQTLRRNLEDQILNKFKELIYSQSQSDSKQNLNQCAQLFESKITEAVTKKKFQNMADMINNCQKFPRQQQLDYSKHFVSLQNIFNELNQQEKKISIKINQYFEEFILETFTYLEELHSDIIRLENIGFCGKNQILKGFDEKFKKFEQISFLWTHVHQLENNDVAQITFQWNEKETRDFFKKLLEIYIVENQSQIIIEVPIEKVVTKEVEKIITKEVPVYIDRIIEKINRVEVPTEVYKEVYREVSKNDRIREAHEYLFGMIRSQNTSKALEIYHEEASKQNAAAYNSLGQIFYEGKQVNQDLKQAYDSYEFSAQKNNPEGLYWHGTFLVKGIACQTQYDAGITDLEKAAEAGHVDAMTDLGERVADQQFLRKKKEIYLVPPSYQDAEAYFVQAKKQGSVRATCGLGIFYLSLPDYVSQFNNESAFSNAIVNLELAIKQKYPPAYFYLGHCYEYGFGVSKDLQKAYELYKEGSLTGDMDCIAMYLPSLLSNPNENFAKIHHYTRQLLVINPEFGVAHYVLAFLYENGLGVQKDQKLAFSYYEKGASFKNMRCIEKLGDCYRNGMGVVQNQQVAMEWYCKGAEMNDEKCIQKAGLVEIKKPESPKAEKNKTLDYFSKAYKLVTIDEQDAEPQMEQTGNFQKQLNTFDGEDKIESREAELLLKQITSVEPEQKRVSLTKYVSFDEQDDAQWGIFGKEKFQSQMIPLYVPVSQQQLFSNRSNQTQEDTGRESLLVSEIMPQMDSKQISQAFFDVTKKQTTWNQYPSNQNLQTKRNSKNSLRPQQYPNQLGSKNIKQSDRRQGLEKNTIIIFDE